MNSFTIAGIGELLWDILGDTETLGGAPINFTHHASSLGADGFAISTIGDDIRGATALIELQKRNMSCDHITTAQNGMTGYVQARIDQLGVAAYEFPDNVAWDNIILQESTKSLAKTLDAVCFGSLAQRSIQSRNVIQNYLKSTGEKTLKVFDLNIRQQFYTEEIIYTSLKIADVLKLNDDEILLMATMHGLQGDDNSTLEYLVNTYQLQLAALTRGAKGSLLITPTQQSDRQGFASEIVDTIGAGDSFTAATVIGFLNGTPLENINEHANRVAAFVCSQKGAMPELPGSLLNF